MTTMADVSRLELNPTQIPTDLLLKPTYHAFKDLRKYLTREERRKWALLNPALFNEWYVRPYDKKWKTDTPDFHLLMLEFVLSHDRTVIHVPVEHAKCVAKGTMIEMADGTQRPIEDVRPGDEVVTLLDNYKLGISRVRKVFSEGSKEGFELLTRTGRRIVASADHKFLTEYGWTRLVEISPRMRVAVPRLLPEQKNPVESVTVEEARLLGYLVGDGTVKRSAEFTNSDPDILQDFLRCAQSLGFTATVNYTSDCMTSFELHPSVERRHSHDVSRWLKKHQLWSCDSRTKRVPLAILNGSSLVKKEFLKAYFSCDGSVSLDAPYIEVTTISYQLAVQVLRMLLQFGILAYLKEGRATYRKKDCGPVYSVVIQAVDEFEKFHDRIGFIGEKAQRLEELVNRVTTKSCPRNDVVPSVLVARTRSRDTLYYLDRDVSQQNVSRHVLERMARQYDNPVWLQLATSDVLWDEVISVRPIGQVEMYDLEVADTHNYIANLIVTHNSTLFSIGFPLWLTYRDRNLRGAIISNTARQAAGFMRRIMWHIANNPRLKEDFGTFEEGGVEPSFREKWNEEQMIVKRDVWGQSKDPTWQALGVEGAIYGARLDVAILDDVIDLSNSLTEHTRKRVEDWFHEMLESRIVDGGQIIVLGTLQHEKDLLCTLSENPEYAYLRLECYDEETGTTLWPAVWPEERVLRRKRSIGSTRFRKQMQNDRRARTGNRLKTEWLNFYGPQHEVQLPTANELIFYAGVDPAITDSREKAELEDLDFFVLTVLGYHPAEARVFGIEQVRFRGTLPQQIDILEEKHRQYQFKLVGIESNAYQKALAQAARLSKLMIPVKPVNTTLGKIPRMEVLASHFETKRIWIPPTWNAFIDEWMDFPDGAHDDTLDSLDIGFRILQEDVREMEDEELRRKRRVAKAHVV